jgi:hypothetical protein
VRASLSTIFAHVFRWGRVVYPAWVHGDPVTAPGAGATLVSKTVSSNKRGYIYGFIITVPEPNAVTLSWISSGATRTLKIEFGGKGTLKDSSPLPINEGYPADPGTNISITVVNAGSAGLTYQASLLVGEV